MKDKTSSGGDTGIGAKYLYMANTLLATNLTRSSGTASLVSSMSYDSINRLSKISSQSRKGANRVGLPVSYEYQYNSANQRVRTALSDGSYWVYQYDALGQVTRGSRYWSDGSPVAGQNFTYGFDGIGNRTASGGRASAFSNYQPANRWNQLTSRSVAPAVDVIGTANAKSTVTVSRDGGTPLVTSRHGEYFHTAIAVPNASAAYPRLSLTASGSGLPDTSGGKVYVPPAQESFTYDLDGNLTSDSRWKYRWDAENRLVEMTGNSGTAAAGNQRISFGYDAAGRRISKRYTPAGSTTTTVTLFVYDGWNLVAELDGVTFATQRTYAWGSDLSGTLTGAGGVGGLLWESVAGNGTHFVSYDGNGNVMGLNSATDGSNTARFEYGPFGEPIRASGPLASASSIRFSSKYTDQESGIVYYGYRFYNAVTGRWINRDPIGEADGPHLFAFVRNNATGFIDPFGLMTKAECAALAQQIFRKAAGLLDDLQRYDPIEDAKGGHPMGGGKVTKPGGHFIEIRQRQRGLGKDVAKYARECIKCDDDNEPGARIPRWITEMANRPVPEPVFEKPREWIDYVPGTPEQLETAGDVSILVGATIIVVVAPEVLPAIRIPPIRIPPVRIPIPQPAY